MSITENGRGFMSVTGDANLYNARITRVDRNLETFDYAVAVNGQVQEVKDVPFTAFTPDSDKNFIIAEERMPKFVIGTDNMPKTDYIITEDINPRRPSGGAGFIITNEIMP